MQHEGPGKEKGSRTSFPRIPSDCVGFRGRGCDRSALWSVSGSSQRRGILLRSSSWPTRRSQAKVRRRNHLVRRQARFMGKTRISYVRFIMQVERDLVDGIRTHDLLIAYEKNLRVRHGAAIT